MVYCYINNINEFQYCKNCGIKRVKFIDFNNGYGKYCCKKCTANGSKDVRIKTYFKKTGYNNPAYNPDVLIKRRKTYLKNTGYNHPSKNPLIKKLKKQKLKESGFLLSHEKIRKRSIDKYGIDYKIEFVQTEYNSIFDVICITCPVHGKIETTAIKHLRRNKVVFRLSMKCIYQIF